MSGLDPQARARLAAALGPLAAHMAVAPKHRPLPFWRGGENKHQRLARCLLQTNFSWRRCDNLFLRQAVNDPNPSRESKLRLAALRHRFWHRGAVHD